MSGSLLAYHSSHIELFGVPPSHFLMYRTAVICVRWRSLDKLAGLAEFNRCRHPSLRQDVASTISAFRTDRSLRLKLESLS